MRDRIPHPELSSWMHERCHVPREDREATFARWRRQPAAVVALDAVFSRVFRALHIHRRPGAKWTLYRLVRGALRVLVRCLNRVKVYGRENVPETGCIFYVNHPGQFDPVFLITSLDQPVSAFISWGNGWFADMFEDYGFVYLRPQPLRVQVERMVRELVLRNRFFAIWPEGHPTGKAEVEAGFSSIVRVYAVLNAKRDVIPFVPVLLRGTEVDNHGASPRPGPVEVHFFEPLFLDRGWLEPPWRGGKSPREIVDFLMLHLARKRGQKALAENPRLEGVRRRRAATTRPLPTGSRSRIS
ncbi:MAG: lysophospholipid acyltransferase family protein [Promethearchaeota archaeon]